MSPSWTSPETAGSSAVSIVAVTSIPEVHAGDDLGQLIHAAMAAEELQLVDGDVIVVTSKVVSKAEGRTRPATERLQAIADETDAVIAQRGDLQIVRTHHGFVMAAAGVDISNADDGTVLLLPQDPDASARRLRKQLQDLSGKEIGVIVTDTFGRPWRDGLTDVAIGAAGVVVLDDHRGRRDTFGRALESTVVATADELAAAADVVKGKARGIPVAVVRGSGVVSKDDGPGAAAIVRPSRDDLFTMGTHEAHRVGQQAAISLRRTIRAWTDAPVNAADVRAAVSDAVTAPAPHSTTPWRFVHLTSTTTRDALLQVMRERWIADLRADGLADEAIAKRVARGDLLRHCPELLIPVLVLDGAHDYPDTRRRHAERDMFVLSMGAAVQSLMVSLAARGLGSAWVSSTLFCPEDVQAVLDLPRHWWPMGAIALGYPLTRPAPRSARDAGDFIIDR